MEHEEIVRHLVAGALYGRDATCGTKVRCSKLAAELMAQQLTRAHAKTDGKVLEAYPCAWCGEWHAGRAMDETEVAWVQGIIDRARQDIARRRDEVV